eukprot:TRINITY_DN22609_c0_g1_i1.p1 TRINITY_DN22609_c0_g1~~TRINITY_DN22609_c0_g1_i1.p1  ORF type:complete len:375 (+),score=125.46 TRINITY_DN22609_c0_g1_i1:99-1223(+)
MTPRVAAAEEEEDAASPHEVYRQACDAVGCKPNPELLKQLPQRSGADDGWGAVRQLNCAANFLGALGLDALLPVLRTCWAVTHVKLSNNGLRNPSALKLLAVAQEACPSLVSLDLSQNKHLSLAVGTAAIKLAKAKRTLTHLCLAKTGVSGHMQGKLEMILTANRKHAAQQAAAKLEGKHIEPRTYFAARRVFAWLDTDGGGSVTRQEMLAERSKIAHKKEAVGYPFSDFDEVDADQDGVITLEEYLGRCFPKAVPEDLTWFGAHYGPFVVGTYVPPPDLGLDQLQEIRDIFDRYDANADGRVTLQELKASLHKSPLAMANPDDYFDACDADGDGVFSFPEFIEAMRYYYTGLPMPAEEVRVEVLFGTPHQVNL